MNRDPIGYAGGENLYAYCGGDPVNEVDPSGTSSAGDFASGWLSVGLDQWSQSPANPFFAVNAIQNEVGLYNSIKTRGFGGTASAIGSGMVHSYTDIFSGSSSPYAKGRSAATIADTIATAAIGAGAYSVAGAAEGASVATVAEDIPDSAAQATGEGDFSTDIQQNGISGYTKHGINQAISRNGRGVSPSAILDTIRNPKSIVYDAERDSVAITGSRAKVVLNRQREIITVMARGHGNTRIQRIP